MKRVLSSGAGLLLIALAFLAFNMVSGLLFSGARLDLTEQKLYTISPGTKRILAGLDEPINLYFFYSDSGARELVPLRNTPGASRNCCAPTSARRTAGFACR